MSKCPILSQAVNLETAGGVTWCGILHAFFSLQEKNETLIYTIFRIVYAGEYAEQLTPLFYPFVSWLYNINVPGVKK